MRTPAASIVLCCLFIFHLAILPVFAHEETVSPRNIMVQGTAELWFPADRLNIQIGVLTTGDIAERTLQDNTALMLQAEAALRRIGLKEGEFETGRFQIQPQWTQRPRQAASDWQPRIAGYVVTNTLTVKTQQIELAGKIIESCITAGANTVDSIFFDLANPQAYRSQVIAAATANAIADAQAVAKAASVTLQHVLSIRLDDMSPVPYRIQRGALAEMAAVDAGAAPPIVPGNIAVKAQVSIQYQISQ
jgi:hypothetical protein